MEFKVMAKQTDVSASPESSVAVFEKFAIFQAGGKQYQALEGKTVSIEKIEGEPGDTFTISEVLLRKLSDAQVEIGQPFVAKPITASIVKHIKEPKVIVFKFKRRTKSRVKKGHRQAKTVIRIESI